MDLRLGIVEGFWTPRTAEQAKALSERWEAQRETHEAALREAISVPEGGAASVAVSIDGRPGSCAKGERPG